ncbi:hypothetical protein [Rhodophyticola sp. CCM32]|uniref:hypothetical protein n=1 Tax=Rhodophyticola sp. CCM32 TaxID=2916397 RepID=UPI001EE53055|nr:hypothetical protein [Rhodophyticola sp. CCM32]
MGVGTILDAQQLLLLACGESKARVVAKAIEGPLSARVSASAIQLHTRCIVIVDAEAAAELQDIDYYSFVCTHEEKWHELRSLILGS